MKIIQHKSARATRGKHLTLVWGIHSFPAGEILVALSHEGICWLGINCKFADLQKNWPGAEFVEDEKLTGKAAREIAKLWPRDLGALSIPVVLYGTEFQLKVWRELLKIKPGATLTYARLAQKIGKPSAVRAVGSAVGKNTVSIVVPCHRVINTSGTKISYGWGPAVKIALLKGEGVA
jgi:AraC family transcriptional regulator of adaptative response/methylated-DNA-[protein]-cysteine methyltransferase